MSSCFTCDVGFETTKPPVFGNMERIIYTNPGIPLYAYKYHHCVDVLNGTGFFFNDSQHDNSQKINYVSYRIKHIKIKGRLNIKSINSANQDIYVPNFFVLMKGSLNPGNHAWGDYDFSGLLQDFRYFKEPENVLGFSIKPVAYITKEANDFYISCNKTFYIGPNEGIYMDYLLQAGNETSRLQLSVYATAKIWYDII